MPSASRARADAAASARAFAAHAGAVARFLRATGVTSDDLEDLVQQVFLDAHEKGGYRPGEASERTWFLRLAWYARTSLRRERARATVALVGEPEVEPTQDRSLDAHRGLARVERALATLSDEHRAALLLFDVEGFSAAEVADAMEIPVGTVHSRVHIARRRLAAALANPCVHTDAAQEDAS